MIPENLDKLSEFEIAQLLRPLSAEEKRIIRLRFGLGGTPTTMTGASEATGLPREEIRRIELQAMEKLGWITFAR
jgi:DNA-directed RNA polymerase sigma subunit (sigma70/sigma32)